MRLRGVERGANLVDLQRFKEAKSLMRRTVPVARRVLGEGNRLTLKMRWSYAIALFLDDGATLDDLREAVTTLEGTTRIARRVFGGVHPTTMSIEANLESVRAVLRARKMPFGSSEELLQTADDPADDPTA